ncbi:G5 domain-containing protein [Streptococcus ruminantium]|uniref:G5 domain-containing protein n=1 Tax=Streptococcus ruminantium TaxID=1917441 RepID=UPI0012DC8E82|nr:G5 domain-containing protein [Streptococcus ruminantium]
MKNKKFQGLVGLALIASLVNPLPWFENVNLLDSVKVLAAEEEPPADEDVPDANELKIITDARNLIQGIRDWIADGEKELAEEDFAILETDHIPLLNNISNIEKKAPGLLADVEKLRKDVLGGVPVPDPKITEEKGVVPVRTVYIENPDAVANVKTVLNEGTPGEITYKVTNGVRDQGIETTPMVPKRVSVGTKPTVVTEAIPAPADIEEQDSNLEEGKRELKTAAVSGSKTTTTTYTLDKETGIANANKPTVEEKAGTAAVYRVGTKKVDVSPVVTTRTEPIVVTTVYTADPAVEANKQIVTFEGVAGETTYTTTNGVEDSGVVTTVMQPKRISVGTKPTVVIEAIPAPADIEEQDSNLEEGKRELKTAAVSGSKTTTTTYTLDKETGIANANKPTVEEKAGTAAVYRVGTKKVDVSPVVTTRTEPILVTTVYTADPAVEANKQIVTFEGVAGETTYTTTNGVEDAGVVTTVMQPRQVTVGTKTSILTEFIPAPADVEELDMNLEKGKRELKTPATEGAKTTTTTYTLDPITGIATANESVVIVTPGTPAVYRVGNKKAVTPIVSEEVVTESIAFTKETRENKDLPKGTTRVVQEGKDGVRTIVYTVTTVDGQETSRLVKSDTATLAVVEITEVGTKEVVSMSQIESKDDLQPKSDNTDRQGLAPAESKKVLPQTGEQTSIFAAFGAILLSGIAGILAFHRKKE